MDLKVYMKTYILIFSFVCKAGVGVAEIYSTLKLHYTKSSKLLHYTKSNNLEFFFFCEIAQDFLV